ncbi:MAG: hypothetical protein HS120_09640 [Burkholderiales bacterium]|nr:hypothetical protein [Burkholderiales bacterium]
MSQALTQRYGQGFSVTNLKYFRLFYQTCSNRQPEIGHEPCDQFEAMDQSTVLADLHSALAKQDSLKRFFPRLSWTHYRTLCMVEERAERLVCWIRKVGTDCCNTSMFES